MNKDPNLRIASKRILLMERQFGLGNQSGQGAQPKRRFFRLTTIRNQTAQQIDQEVDRTSVARMLNLRNVLKLVNNRFHNRPFSEQDFIHQRHERIFHVGAKRGDPFDAESAEELVMERFGEIAFVAKQFTKESAR
ncbi:MAG: hypothetical protein KatS3mg046_713 [Bellilinea sp.]|nr:MAG: hypothetical protein KatS3mg046_713 [Bellilinea sp.]